MPDTIKTGTILIKDGTFLPDALRFESESCAPGWRLVKDLDGYALDREIHEAGWTFFYQAGEIKATVFVIDGGIDGENIMRRAIERILANPKSEKLNSLEITQVAPKRFLGIRCVTVSAHSRHIQEGLILFRAKNLQELVPTRSNGRPIQSIGLASGMDVSLQDNDVSAKFGNDLESVIV